MGTQYYIYNDKTSGTIYANTASFTATSNSQLVFTIDNTWVGTEDILLNTNSSAVIANAEGDEVLTISAGLEIILNNNYLIK